MGQKSIEIHTHTHTQRSVPKWQASYLLVHCQTCEAIQGRKSAGEFDPGEYQQDGVSFWKRAEMKES